MHMEVRVPTLGESMTEATVGRWFKSVGEAVAQDEALLELETDKVTVEVPAPVSGTLLEIAAESGATVEIGALLARVAEGAGAIGGEARPDPAPVAAAAESPAPAAEPDPPPSPAARKLIDEHGLDAARIPGTGKDGRIVKGDVLARVAPPAPSASAPAGAERARGEREERVRMTRLRRRIAERLKEAQNTAAILTTYNEADMSAVMALRGEMRDEFERKHGVRLGFMSFFVKACVAALQEIPAVNAEIVGDEIVYKNHYDIGVAVGTGQGLVVPVVRDADALGFAELEKAIADLGARARDGKLALAELQGGTFSISNGGVYGSLMSSPILNPPQSGILGMHKIQKRPVVEGDDIVVRPMMYLALSYDHRIVDGREAVTFLVRVKACIEDPRRLLLGL
ncbi:MAG: 2-oxoglutarate dehydrogenase complex dihydrolipoyllysine-residue succinyltransferase [Alphaproteobacteria bacterium]|nr:2-oxoglutarate dehydrogenase complex dihydrolipoyllysine-residue succinyltransferase [Alphaproteobacteria bacterium]